MGYIPWGGGAAVPESPILCTVSLCKPTAPSPFSLRQTPFVYSNVSLYLVPLATHLFLCLSPCDPNITLVSPVNFLAMY